MAVLSIQGLQLVPSHDDVIKSKHFPRNWPFVREFTASGEFPTQRPVARSFDVFLYLRLNKRLSKQPWGWWFETPSWSLWRHRNVSPHSSLWNPKQKTVQCNTTEMSCPCPIHSTRRCVFGSTNGLMKVTNQGTHWYFTRCKAMQYDVLEHHFYPASFVVNIGDVFLSRVMRWVMILWWFAPKKTLTADILIWRVVCSCVIIEQTHFYSIPPTRRVVFRYFIVGTCVTLVSSFTNIPVGFMCSDLR